MASMANNRNKRFSTWNALAGVSLGLMSSTQIWAGDVNFKPTVSLNERYSDNVKLAPINPIDSFVTEIRPGFVLNRVGARAEFSVDYGLQALLYSHDSDANAYNNQLSARFKSGWLDEHFVINGEARIGQQNTNSTGALGTGNYNLTNNRSETRSLGITPTWKSNFGKQANFEARWQFSYTDSDSVALPATNSNNLTLSLANGRAFNRLLWGVTYRLQKSDANANGDRSSSLSGNIGFLYSPKTRFNLTLGTDSNNGTTTGFNQASGFYWNAGVNWSPTLRTSLSATAGKRYNGNSYGLNFTHRTRKSTWALRYSEEIIDAYAQVTALGAFDVYDCAGIPKFVVAGGSAPASSECGGLPPQLVFAAGILPYSQLVNGFNLTKSWSGVTTYKTGKSVFSLNLNSSRRELLASNSADDTYSLGGSWALRVGPRLRSTVLANSSHAETATAQSDDWSMAWLLAYQLSRQTTGQLELRRVERTSGTGTAAGAYEENSVSARLNMSF
jgi:uncharacterized protein (PEP-CTERM system associated)